MFTMTKATAKLANLNIRAELHGEETRTAVDLKLEMRGSNDILSALEPGLKEAFYQPQPEGEGQGDLLAGSDPNYLPALRFPLIDQPIKWGKEFAGYRFRMPYGIDETTAIVLDTCGVDGFRFDMQDGGTVVTVFRVVAHPDQAAIGKLCDFIQQQISFDLLPPEPGYGDLDDDEHDGTT